MARSPVRVVMSKAAMSTTPARHLVNCKEAFKGVAQDDGTRSLELEVFLEWCAVEEALRHGIQVASIAQIRKASERSLGNA